MIVEIYSLDGSGVDQFDGSLVFHEGKIELDPTDSRKLNAGVAHEYPVWGEGAGERRVISAAKPEEFLQNLHLALRNAYLIETKPWEVLKKSNPNHGLGGAKAAPG